MDMQTILNLPRTLKNVGRMREVVAALGRFGFAAVFAKVLPEEWTAWLSGRAVSDKLDFNDRVRMLLEELGPTFVKLGQILATRKDLVPPALMQELRQLQDKVQPFSSAIAREQVESELKRPVTELFAHFEEEPLAAASIGQVHRARLADGSEVVVKIQRPGIEQVISADLEIILTLAELIQPELGKTVQLDLVQFIREFQKSILREIDYRVEAANTRTMERKLAEVPGIAVPQLYPALSTDKVLTLEFFDGVSVREVETIEQLGFDPCELATRGTDIALKMALEWGFFHADPHPGNLFVLKDGRLGLIDFGSVGILDEEMTDFLAIFLLGIFTGDADRLVKLFYRMDMIGHQTDVRALKADIRALMVSYLGRDMAELDVGQFVGEIFDVIAIHHVEVMPQVLLVLKALVTIIGVAETLNPQYNVLDEVKGVVLSIYMRKLANPENLARRAYHQVDELIYLARSLPRELHTLVSKMNRDVHVARHEVSLPKHELTARDRWVNRALLALLCGFLTLTGSGLAVWLHETPGAHWLMIALAALQLSLAGGIGVGLTFRFVRTGW